MTDPRFRLFIADAQDSVRASITLLCAQSTSLELVGTACSGDDLVAAVDLLQPDALITDLGVPCIEGLRVIRRLRKHHPTMKIIVFSMYRNPTIVTRAIEWGADSYVLKSQPLSELGAAIMRVSEGQRYVSPPLDARLVAESDQWPEDVLTPRQLEIFLLMARGHSFKQISQNLALSPKTVNVHRASIMKRLGLRELASLALYAVRVGVLDPETGARATRLITPTQMQRTEQDG